MERTGPSARDDLSEFEAPETRPLMSLSGCTLIALAERAGASVALTNLPIGTVGDRSLVKELLP